MDAIASHLVGGDNTERLRAFPGEEADIDTCPVCGHERLYGQCGRCGYCGPGDGHDDEVEQERNETRP